MKRKLIFLLLICLLIGSTDGYSTPVPIHHVCVGSTTPPPCSMSMSALYPGGVWTSNNPLAIDVDPVTGMLTVHSAGNAIITYTVTTGCGNLVFSYQVIADPLPVITSPALVLCVGTNGSLSANPPPPAGVWSSGAPLIASVDPFTGLVNGLAPGIATITYTNSSTGCYATTDVTVNALPSPISGPAAVCPDYSIGMFNPTPGGTWSCSPASVASIDPLSGLLTGVDSNFAPGPGAIVTYTIPGGCFVTKPVTVYAKPVIVGPDAVCMLSTINLTGKFAHLPSPPSVPGTWSTSDPGTATISPLGVVTGVAPGTAIITFTRPTGCFATKTITVGSPFLVDICEIAPFETCDNVISYCTGLTLRVSGAPEGSEYSWSPSIPADESAEGPDAIFTFTTAPAATAIYTVTVTGPGGCTAQKTVRIFVATGGCYPCDYLKPCNTSCEGCDVTPYFKTIADASLTNANVSETTVGYYYIPKRTTNDDPTITTLNVNPAPGSVFFMGKNVTLKVSTHVTLTGVHMFSSPTCRWKGISLENTSSAVGQITVNDNTLIEHAIKAGILVEGASPLAYLPSSGNVIESNNAIYNKDFSGIHVEPFKLSVPGTYPFLIKNSVFTARDFCSYHSAETLTAYTQYPFVWPTANQLKASPAGEIAGGYNPGFNIDAFPGTIDYDLCYGITLRRSGHKDSISPTSYIFHGLVIGDPGNAANTNLFDTIGHGTDIIAANAKFYNNIFRLSDWGIGGDLSGYSGEKYSIEIVPGIVDSTSNRFYNCVTGFAGGSWHTLTIRKALMSANRTGSIENYGINNSGHIFGNHYFGNHLIEENTIRNLYTGISERLESCMNPNSAITIKGNTISGITGMGTNELGRTAILIEELKTCTTPGAYLSIDANYISGYREGIFMDQGSATTPTSFITDITRNQITLIASSTSDADTRCGIKCNYSQFISHITGNYIFGDLTKGFDYNSPSGTSSSTSNSHVGIQLITTSNSSSTRADVSCNYVRDIPVGFRFHGLNSIDWRRNVMQRNTHGMTLYSLLGVPGEIGDQGDACHPSDNVWFDDGVATGGWPGWSDPSVYQTFTVNSDPSFSKLYVRNSTATPNVFKPTYNGSDGTAYNVGTTVLDATTGCIPEYDACVVVETGEGGGGGMGRPAPDGRLNGDVKLTAVTGNYSVFPNPGDGNLTIKQSIAADQQMDVKVLNYAGAEIQKTQLTFTKGESRLNIGKVAPGMYMLILSGEDGATTTFRVMIQ